MSKFDEMIDRLQVIIIVWGTESIKESHVSNGCLMDDVGFDPGVDTAKFE